MKPTIQKALLADSVKSMQLLVSKQNQIEQHWRVLGSEYDYDVKNLVSELFADKKWYNKLNSKGDIVRLANGDSVPMSAKKAYILEKRNEAEGVAHLVRQAERWFTKFRRENKANDYKAIKR